MGNTGLFGSNGQPAAPPYTNGPYTFDQVITFSNTVTISGTLAVSSSTASDFSTAGLRTIQAVTNVHDTAPTDAELDTAFGTPASLGRGFIGTVDDADGDTNFYLCLTSDASWYYLKFTKAA